MSVCVRAPGKAIVCGEYAVLTGAPATSVAVDRHVVARRVPGNVALEPTPFVTAAVKHVAAALDLPVSSFEPMLAELAIDSSALYDRELKIGLGSSAAVTAAVVGLAVADAGRELPLARLFEITDAAHAEAQRVAGSGIDVATSIYGGAIRFQREGSTPKVFPVSWPAGLKLSFVFAGESASTPELVGKVKALAARDAARHQALIGALASLSIRFAEAIEAGELTSAIAAAAAWQPALAELGRAADAPLVTPIFEQLAEIASAHGAASKPSGAGGGDLAVLLSRAADTVALEAALTEAGYTPLSLVPHGPAQGLSVERTP